MSLAVRVSITGSPVVMDSSLGLGQFSSFPMEEACASSGMGFRATESLKGSFVGAGSELARGGPQLRGLRVGVGIRCLEGFGTVVLWLFPRRAVSG